MREKPKGATEILRSVVRLFREKDIPFLSAAIAFYAFFSIIPAVLLALAVGSFLGGEGFAERAVSFARLYLSPEGEKVLSEALSDSAGRVGASAFGLLALAWSALKVFRAVDVAFDIIYGKEVPTSFGRRILNGLVVMVVIVVGVVLTAGVRFFFALSGIGVTGYPGVAVRLLSVGAFALVLLPVYYLMPPVSVSLRSAVPGTAATVAGWLLLRTLFRLYAQNAFQYQAYGLVGAVLLFLLWLYVGAMVLLLGAAVNVTFADRTE